MLSASILIEMGANALPPWAAVPLWIALALVAAAAVYRMIKKNRGIEGVFRSNAQYIILVAVMLALYLLVLLLLDV